MRYKQTIVLLLISILVFSQEEKKNYNDSIIDVAYNLRINKKTTEALALLENINNENDPYYYKGLVQKMYCYDAEKKIEDVIKVCDQLLKSEKEKSNSEIYIIKANALDELKKYTEAESVFKEVCSKFPYSYLAYFNYAVNLINQKRNQDAIEALKKSISINPYYSSSHLLLGSIALDSGKFSEALMSYGIFFTIAPNDSRVENVVRIVNKTLSEKYVDKAETLNFSSENFSKSEKILKSLLALSENYNSGFQNIKLPIINQFHALIISLKDYKKEKDFYSTIYVNFYKKLLNENQFNGFVYTMFSGYENTEIQELVKKNKRTVEDYFKWLGSSLNETTTTRNEENKTIFQEYNNYELESFGEKKDNKKEGLWTLINRYGCVEAQVTMKNDKENGSVKYYNVDKKLIAEGNFQDGQPDGEVTFYNEEGYKTIKRAFQKGKMNGLETSYYHAGENNINCINSYQDNKQEGDAKCYYPDKTLKEKAIYFNGKLNGAFVSYYPNGQIEKEGTYKDNLYEGIIQSYYPDGSKETKADYSEGVIKGKYTEYYPNGQLKVEYIAENDVLKEPVKKYYPNGVVSSISNFNKKGLLDGEDQIFYPNGKKHYELDYNKGEVKKIRFFEKGIFSSEQKVQKNEFVEYKDFFGNLISKGKYLKDNYDGEWVYFYPDGTVKSKMFYKESKLDGEYMEYYPNGKTLFVYSYLKDQLQGPYKRYALNGTLTDETFYRNGKINGAYKKYSLDGKLITESYYVDDDPHGDKIYYNNKGEKSVVQKFNYGKLIKNTYYLNNKEADVTDFLKQKGTVSNSINGGGEIITRTIKDGSTYGKYIVKDKQNHILVEGDYLNDKNYGNWKTYSFTNNIRYEWKTLNDLNYGDYKAYDFHGNLKIESKYLNGKLYGEEIRYNGEGNLEYKANYLDNKKYGNFEFYGENKQKLLTLYYLEDDLQYAILNNSKDTIFTNKGSLKVIANYPSGKKGLEISFKNNERNGIYAIWKEDGRPIITATYENDKIVGKRTIYYKNNQVYSEENFDESSDYQGEVALYYANGKLKAKANFVRDQLEGEAVLFDENGNIQSKKIYLNDEIFEIIK